VVRETWCVRRDAWCVRQRCSWILWISCSRTSPTRPSIPGTNGQCISNRSRIPAQCGANSTPIIPDDTTISNGCLDRKTTRKSNFVIGATNRPQPGWTSGVLFGMLLSLPDAIITKAWVPILALSAIGGAIIGMVVGTLGNME
jgi:hypothetical protein